MSDDGSKREKGSAVKNEIGGMAEERKGRWITGEG